MHVPKLVDLVMLFTRLIGARSDASMQVIPIARRTSKRYYAVLA
jgi:hypothetical protein